MDLLFGSIAETNQSRLSQQTDMDPIRFVVYLALFNGKMGEPFSLIGSIPVYLISFMTGSC